MPAPRTRRRFSDVERAEALAALKANGGNVLGTATQLGIPENTLRHWAKGERNPPPANLGEAKKIELSDFFERVARDALEAISPEKIGKSSAQQLATVAAIAVDKMRLLRDQPTTIGENRGTLDARILVLTKALNDDKHTAGIVRAIEADAVATTEADAPDGTRAQGEAGGDHPHQPVHPVDADGQAG